MGCASARIQNQSGPTAWLLGDGTRLHLQHGPIDLIIDAVGSATEVQRSFEQATVAFQSVLDTLAEQLSILRRAYQPLSGSVFKGPVAKRMQLALHSYSQYHVTPMAAVAGSVADHILDCMTRDRKLDRAQVNNGGDIALYLSPGSEIKIGICTAVADTTHTDAVSITSDDNVRGVATSGWQGRSFSLGIADAVTVLSATAASADVAATVIANAVNLPSNEDIVRVPASSLQPDSDLGSRLVTVDVPQLPEHCKTQALDSGQQCAEKLIALESIHSCYLHLQGQSRVIESSSFQSVFPVSLRYAIC